MADYGWIENADTKDNDTFKELARDICLHVAALNPAGLTRDDIDASTIEEENEINRKQLEAEGKPAEIAEKMVVGRMKKFTGEISLTGQAFIMEPKKTVGEILKEKKATVTNFIRLEVGEGIEKKEEDFAAEVAAQIAATKKA